MPERLSPDGLRRNGIAADRPALAALKRQDAALEELKRSHEALARRVEALERRVDGALLGMLEGIGGPDGGLTAGQGRAALNRETARALASRPWEKMQALETSAHLQKVTEVANSVQAAAFGQRGSLLADNNLLLAANQLLWALLDPLLRKFGIVEGTEPSLVSWLAPAGSLLTGHLALGNKQHVRVLTGVAVFESGARVHFESLRDRIGDDLWITFRERTDVPVTTFLLDGTTKASIRADVHQGVLRIAITSIDDGGAPPRLRVAWTVDTGVGSG